ncbi:hypothetical protein BTE77_24860 [Ensifer adhaerens]|nr:hypothetical protein BTE77_24860 [Ensifer adhaerens]
MSAMELGRSRDQSEWSTPWVRYDAVISQVGPPSSREKPTESSIPGEARSPHLAVLIDADNAYAKIVDGLFEEIAKIGEASVSGGLRMRLEARV